METKSNVHIKHAGLPEWPDTSCLVYRYTAQKAAQITKY